MTDLRLILLDHITYVHTTFYHSSGLTRNLMFKWKYLLCFKFAYTAFLLGVAEVFIKQSVYVINFYQLPLLSFFFLVMQRHLIHYIIQTSGCQELHHHQQHLTLFDLWTLDLRKNSCANWFINHMIKTVSRSMAEVTQILIYSRRLELRRLICLIN